MPGLHSIDWHPVIAIPVAALSAFAQISQRPCRLYGWSFLETTGAAPATLDLIDGGNASGASLSPFSLTAGQSTRDWLGKPGLLVQSGLSINVSSGTVRGTIWALLLTDAEIAKDEGGYA